MADAQTVELTRVRNLQENLQRIFEARPRGCLVEVARAAQISRVHLSRIIGDSDANPTIETVESLSVALEVPFETLLSKSPSDVDLKIFLDSGRKPS